MCKFNRFRDDPYETRGVYVHREGPRQFRGYRDGNAVSWESRRTYKEAARDALPAWAGGGYDAHYYVNEGDFLDGPFCAECIADMFCDDPALATRIHVESSDSDAPYESDITCDACNRIITPQRCADCGDPVWESPIGVRGVIGAPAPLPPFMGDYYVLHAHCLAKLVARCAATKVGKSAYLVDRERNFFGGQTYTASAH